MKIKEYMEKEKLSHRTFAKKVGVSASTIHHFLTGRTRALSMEVAQKVVKGSGGKISLKDILDEVAMRT